MLSENGTGSFPSLEESRSDRVVHPARALGTVRAAIRNGIRRGLHSSCLRLLLVALDVSTRNPSGRYL